MTTWLTLDSGACKPPFNMAVDEALLDAMPRLQSPVLRFYGWTEPAATFGYFQRFVDVEQATLLRPLIRRPTAGGIVPHDRDWTYSLAIPAGHEWHRLKAIDSYRRMHEWIQQVFRVVGVETELAPASKSAGYGQCFAGWEKFDLLSCGRKLAGAAQRRTRNGLMIQGSVQASGLSVSRGEWQRGMLSSLPGNAPVDWTELKWDDNLDRRVAWLVSHRYGQEAFNRKR